MRAVTPVPYYLNPIGAIVNQSIDRKRGSPAAEWPESRTSLRHARKPDKGGFAMQLQPRFRPKKATIASAMTAQTIQKAEHIH